jgi:hypothetical protein
VGGAAGRRGNATADETTSELSVGTVARAGSGQRERFVARLHPRASIEGSLSREVGFCLQKKDRIIVIGISRGKLGAA